MSLSTIQIGHLSASKLILGSNPFSGYSHQSRERDLEMMHYYTTARIKETMHQAENLGINTLLGRADRYIARVMLEYWDEGGKMQWFAQTCSEYVTLSRSIAEAIDGGAAACYLHGGQMDHFLAQNKLEDIPAAIAQIRDAGLPAGVAGHTPRVFEWAEENLDLDFFVCSYYNPMRRDEDPEHVYSHAYGVEETFIPGDRDAMVRTIQRLSKPVIHYKVLAAGRDEPRQAFAFVAQHLRPQDGVCVGVYTKDRPDMLEEDLRLLEDSLRNRQESEYLS
jgi:hypothetical protein